MLKIAVFGSGRGSNFQAILVAIQEGKIPNARVCIVVSNNVDAGILEIARSNGVPGIHLSRKQFDSDNAFEDQLLKCLHEQGTNFIVLAGYMKKLPRRAIETYRQKIVNIHPALLPKYGGKGMYGSYVHEAVIAAHEKYSGATVHMVDEEYDRGAIVLQEKVTVSPGETPESLAAKVLTIEHKLYPDALRLFAEGKVSIQGAEIAVHH
jgi:phosphoribosylglycinamide formyltransferase-1